MHLKKYLFLFYVLMTSVATAQLPYPYLAPQLEVSIGDQVLTCNNSSIDFGDQSIGTDAEIILSITNIGSAPIIIYGIELAGAPDFSVGFSAPIEGATYLAAGSQISVPIGFHPSVLGEHQGAITIESSDAENSTCSIALTGNGIPSNPLQLRFTEDPSLGYQPVDCGGETFLNLSSSSSTLSFQAFYTFQNTGETSITVSAQSTVIGTTTTAFKDPVLMVPGFLTGFYPSFSLPSGEVSTILTTFFITLADGTTFSCEHRLIVEVTPSPISIIFSPDPSQGYEPIECGTEAFFDLVGSDDAIFSVHYTIQNVTDDIIEIGAETTVEGTNSTSILPGAPVEPLKFRHKFANPTLEAGSIHSILTSIYVTLADGTETVCEHRVIVDKSPGVNRPGGGVRGYVSSDAGFKVYPTLATEQVTLEGPSLVPESYQILNSNGQIIKEGVIPAGQHRTQISTADLSAGHYFLKVGQHTHILRFIISRN